MPRAWVSDLTADERRLFRRLDRPIKIQDFLETIPVNFERRGETCKSPRRMLRTRSAHCIEGAFFAAAVHWFHGARPLLLDLKANDLDVDHVVAPFRHRGRWGAISKTNHCVLRYRDPVYKSIRELAMSYFHEYTLDDGRKTLTSYSAPYDLARHGSDWIFAKQNLWDVQYALDVSRHWPIAPRRHRRTLRRADAIERHAGSILQWSRDGVLTSQVKAIKRNPGTGSRSAAR